MSVGRIIGTIVATVAMVAVGAWAVERGRLGAILVVFGIAAMLMVLCWGLFTKQDRSRVAQLLDLNKRDARDLGSSLLTGLVVAVSVMGLQIYLDIAREKDAREEQLRLSIGVSQSLAGLDAHDTDLSEISLAGKNLDRADLSGADLSDANLEKASLREADLRDANLEGATLYDARLPRAKLSDADLDRADLRFANLGDAEIYARDGYDRASFDEARVNARTCLPADIITGLTGVNKEIKEEELEKTATTVHGRHRADPSFGYQCPLTADNVIDDLNQYEQGRTYRELAGPWRVRVDQVLPIFEANPDKTLMRESLRVKRRICAGATRAHVERTQWDKGLFVIALRRHGTPVRQTTAVPVPHDGNQLRSPVALGEPLEPGDLVILFAIPSTTDEGLDSKFIKRIRVRRCRPPRSD